MTGNWPLTLLMVYGLTALPLVINRAWHIGEEYYWRCYWRRAARRRD